MGSVRVSRRVVVLAAALTFLVLVVVAAVLLWRALDRTGYEQAVASLPAETLRVTYTDWQQVRTLANGSSVASPGEAEAFVERAYDQDLAWTSAVAESTYLLDEQYGFSPLDAEWEIYGQSRGGAVVAMKLPASVDLATVEENLRSLGYQPPADGAGTGGVWAGTPDLVAQIDPSTTPVLQNLVVLPEEGLVLFSDAQEYAARAADVVLGDEPSLSEAVDGVHDLAVSAGTPVAAVHYAADFACSDLSMATADSADQALASQLVEEAGDLSPLSGLVLAHQRDRTLTVAMRFESPDQAVENLRPRVELASGEAVGQGGSFAERFSIASAKTSGDQVILELEPREREAALLSDLSQGPVLFATC